ncbi:hypothetical protein DXG01_000765 [Tephrocybe rancida]|nr:hypothetical protein DXG01_000765 [Tephrocybe rancida]
MARARDNHYHRRRLARGHIDNSMTMNTTQHPVVEGNLQDAATSPTFNAPDADVVFRSANNTLFRIHTKQLESASDGFPPAPFTPLETEVVDLSENSKTLELMFRFVYARLTPSLDGINGEDLALLAEAVEKYQIHAGIQICKLAMKLAMSKNPLVVLNYARTSLALLMQYLQSFCEHGQVPYFSRFNEAIHVISKNDAASADFHEPLPSPSSLVTGSIRPLRTMPRQECDAWGSFRAIILTSLRMKKLNAGSVNAAINDIKLCITVPSSAPGCCLRETERWQAKALRSLDAIGPFLRE